MPRIRQNIVTGEWVVVSPERALRPAEMAKRPFSSALIHDQPCAFCVGGSAWQTRLRDVGSKHIYVIPNKYPAFVAEPNIEETGHGFYQDSSSVGAHEVIVLLDLKDDLYSLSPSRLAELLSVMQQRVRYWGDDPNLSCLMPFYNQGRESGASVAHPHAQFIATTLIPPRLQKEYYGASLYHQQHQQCVFCAILDHELKENARIIGREHGAVVIADYAPRFPFELSVIPTSHHSSFTKASPASLEAVASVMQRALQKISNRLFDPALNWYIHTDQVKDERLSSMYHWHIEIIPRLSSFGGFELGSEMTIETVLPEVAAEYLK